VQREREKGKEKRSKWIMMMNKNSKRSYESEEKKNIFYILSSFTPLLDICARLMVEPFSRYIQLGPVHTIPG